MLDYVKPAPLGLAQACLIPRRARIGIKISMQGGGNKLFVSNLIGRVLNILSHSFVPLAIPNTGQ
jgi:hypothetical protein